MKIIFEADNIADLKLQIQEYSLVHLGLNIKAMADAMIPKAPEHAQPGKSEERRLNDGTTRLHSPSFPGPMKRPRGRPLGWRKEPTPAVATAVVPEDPATPPPPVDPDFASKDEVKAAIHALNAAKGFDAAKKALEKFNARHLNEVAVANFKDLVLYCEELRLEQN